MLTVPSGVNPLPEMTMVSPRVYLVLSVVIVGPPSAAITGEAIGRAINTEINKIVIVTIVADVTLFTFDFSFSIFFLFHILFFFCFLSPISYLLLTSFAFR